MTKKNCRVYSKPAIRQAGKLGAIIRGVGSGPIDSGSEGRG